MRTGRCCGVAGSPGEALAGSVPTDEDAKARAFFLKAMADPARVKIVSALSNGDLCVCELMTLIGLPQTMVSHHCKILKEARIIAAHRSGKWMNYSLVDKKAIEILNISKHGDDK